LSRTEQTRTKQGEEEEEYLLLQLNLFNVHLFNVNFTVPDNLKIALVLFIVSKCKPRLGLPS